jgi:hypothetical protein
MSFFAILSFIFSVKLSLNAFINKLYKTFSVTHCSKYNIDHVKCILIYAFQKNYYCLSNEGKLVLHKI